MHMLSHLLSAGGDHFGLAKRATCETENCLETAQGQMGTAWEFEVGELVELH